MLAIFLFFLVPPNKKFYQEKVIGYWNDFLVQRNKMDMEYRKADRFEGLYTYSKKISGFFSKKGNKKDVLLLIPPAAYFEKHGIDFPAPEPGVIYYFTGVKSVSIASDMASKANWYVSVYDKQFLIDSVTSIKALQDTIAALKKY